MVAWDPHTGETAGIGGCEPSADPRSLAASVAQNSCANCSETKIPLASKAEQFSVTFGLVPGYGHNNTIEGDPVTAVVIAWDTAAVAESAAGGLYVPAVAALSRTIYRREWGCPPGAR